MSECSNQATANAQSQVTSELSDTGLLHRISLEMIHEENIGALYEKIVDAAVDIMHSDYASMQMLYPERGKSGSAGELRLLAFRGFNPEAAKFWEWVDADSQCVCGQALCTGQRVVAPRWHGPFGNVSANRHPRSAVHAFEVAQWPGGGNDLHALEAAARAQRP